MPALVVEAAGKEDGSCRPMSGVSIAARLIKKEALPDGW